MKFLMSLILSLVSTFLLAQPSWNLVIYTNSTTAYGIVTIDGSPASAGDWVGAFVGSECRAMQEVIINEGNAYVNLQVQGETVETVSFRVWDSSEGKELDVTLTVESNPGNTIGMPPDFLEISAVSAVPVPEDEQVLDVALTTGTTDCFNATNTIFVAGHGNVVVESGASAEFIAGQSIRFLPGFHAQEGSYVHGHITTTGTYCVEAAPALVAAETTSEKEAVIVDAELTELPDCEMVVYPNPNNGEFTVEFRNFEDEIRVMLFNSIGQIVHDELTTDREIRMRVPNLKSGMYYIKAVNKDEQFNQKVIVK